MNLPFRRHFYLFISVGLIVSVLIGQKVYQYETNSIKLMFKNDVDDKISLIENQIVRDLEALYSLKSFYDNSKRVTLSEFTTYTRSLLARHPHIQAFEWAPKVLHEQRDSYFTEVLPNHSQFEITERHEQGEMIKAQQRPEYYPVYFLEPYVTNELAYGFDLASDPERYQTLMSARDSGEPVATASITLVQGASKSKGFLICLALYDGQPKTLEQRKQSLTGYVVGVFHIEEILKDALALTSVNGINTRLMDITGGLNEVLNINQVDSFNSTRIVKDFTYMKNLMPLHGRQWQMVTMPTQDYIEEKRSYMPMFTTVSSMLFILLGTMYFEHISRANDELRVAQRKLQQLIETDALTNIANRRSFDKQLEVEWKRALRDKIPIALLMIDVDEFKRFNDYYGHIRGDNCLKEVAQAIKSSTTRPSDFVARYGGEEFVVILPNTKDAEYVAEQCRKAISRLQIPHQASTISEFVTISVGYAAMTPQANDNFTDLIALADKGLYQAKVAGRDRCICTQVG